MCCMVTGIKTEGATDAAFLSFDLLMFVTVEEQVGWAVWDK